MKLRQDERAFEVIYRDPCSTTKRKVFATRLSWMGDVWRRAWCECGGYAEFMELKELTEEEYANETNP